MYLRDFKWRLRKTTDQEFEKITIQLDKFIKEEREKRRLLAPYDRFIRKYFNNPDLLFVNFEDHGEDGFTFCRLWSTGDFDYRGFNITLIRTNKQKMVDGKFMYGVRFYSNSDHGHYVAKPDDSHFVLWHKSGIGKPIEINEWFSNVDHLKDLFQKLR